MDPLVDEYNKTKKGDINGKVMSTAVQLTQKFVIQVAIVTTSLYLMTLIIQ